jgi:predicted lipoprotein with Yx(FWY)xxD motif
MRLIMTIAAAAAMLTAAPAFAQMMEGGAKMTADGLNDSSGKPLYNFARDTTPGKSACNGPCVTAWPPMMAAGDAKDMGDWTVITRDDGAKQWAYKGKPLYTFAKDAAGQPATGVSAAWPRAK